MDVTEKKIGDKKEYSATCEGVFFCFMFRKWIHPLKIV